MIKEEEIETNLSFVRDHAGEGVALGEIGLDYKIKVKKELQWKVFGELLDIALESDKPVIVHCRYSHRRAFEMAREREDQTSGLSLVFRTSSPFRRNPGGGLFYFCDSCLSLQSSSSGGDQTGAYREDSAGNGHTRKLSGKGIQA